MVDSSGKNKKPFIIIAAILVIAYVGDAIYPTWDWSCAGRSLAHGLHAGPQSIPELKDADERVMSPSRPKGCVLRAHNLLRQAYDRIMVE